MLTPILINIPHPKQNNTHGNEISYSGASNIYFANESPIDKFNADAPTVHVGTAARQVQHSVRTITLILTHIPSHFPCTVNVIP